MRGVSTMGKFIIKATKTGFTHSLKAGNGEVIATGGEVYKSLSSIKNGINSIFNFVNTHTAYAVSGNTNCLFI